MNIEKILQENGVILKGHFLLSSGLHSDTYFEKFRLLEKPELVSEIIETKIDELRKIEPTLCIGPLTGGALVAFAVARLLRIRAFYMEKEKDTLVLKRDFKINKDDKIILCDDVLTTGGSFLKMLSSLQNYREQIVGYFVLINRSENLPEYLSPLIATYQTTAITYQPSECPLCKAGIPIEKRGSGTIPL